MIFKNKGWLSNMAKGVTDLGGYADVILQGGSISKRLSNELTNGELSQLVKHYKIKNYHGAYIDDKMPLKLKNGEIRTYLEDGDVVEMTGYAGDGNKRVGFGSCAGKILPALAKEYFEN
jgi:hypothetical protein